jgi:D-psicose/D-tagatose/L-ribulose 3-epimerase
LIRRAISNIAWGAADESQMAARLVGWGATGVEVAPARVVSRPDRAEPHELWAYRDFWERHGLPIVATQALLFGRPELQLFAAPTVRGELLEYLTRIIWLSAELGAETLVFGSPKNRRRGELAIDEALAIAESFFRELGRRAEAAGVWLALEANPAAYGGDFVLTAEQAWELVRRVDQPGFGLHLDAGGMLIEPPGGGVGELVRQAGPWLRHYHISQPGLAPLDASSGGQQLAWLFELQRHGYAGWHSIEMVSGGDGESDRLASRALHLVDHWWQAAEQRLVVV